MDVTETRTNLFGLDRQGLRDWFAQAGEKPYRADQVMKWMYHRHVTDFAQMTDVGKVLRSKLEAIAEIVPPNVLLEKQSTDGTHKWLLGMDPRNAIEAVFIPESSRGTLCVSSQAGCGLNCTFCSTGTHGFNRNLSTAEIIGHGRVEAVRLSDGRRIDCDTVVFTGDWIPDHELARTAGLPMLPAAKGPIVDGGWHTEQRGVFAVGNLTHPAETADVCALDGRAAATHVMDWLTLKTWPAAVTPIEVEPPFLWAAHTALGITARVAEFVEGCIECRAGDEVTHRTRRRLWTPNQAIHLPRSAVSSIALKR